MAKINVRSKTLRVRRIFKIFIFGDKITLKREKCLGISLLWSSNSYFISVVTLSNQSLPQRVAPLVFVDDQNSADEIKKIKVEKKTGPRNRSLNNYSSWLSLEDDLIITISKEEAYIFLIGINNLRNQALKENEIHTRF